MNDNTIANSIPDSIMDEIKSAIANKDYGSVEIYIESGRVVQITERTIKKTERVNINNNSSVRVFGRKV